MYLPSRSTKAFTLLELIVVIVILGILAAIAIPTFQKVIDRSHDKSTEATVSALLREAQALAALEENTHVTAEDLEAAADDLQVQAVGVQAAQKLTAVEEGSEGAPSAATRTTLLYKIDGNTTGVALASASTRCVLGQVSGTGSAVRTWVAPGAVCTGTSAVAGPGSETTAQPTTQPTAQPTTPSGIAYAYESPNDTNGVLYALGTAGGTQAWQNPHVSGAVTVTASGYYAQMWGHSYVPEYAVDRSTGWYDKWNGTGTGPIWINVDLGSRRLAPTHMYFTWTNRSPQTTVQGSVDGTAWTTLYTSGSWSGQDAEFGELVVLENPSGTQYKHIRVHRPEDGAWFGIAEMELYGTLSP